MRKNIKRKAISIVLVMCMMMVTFTGCKSESDNNETETTTAVETDKVSLTKVNVGSLKGPTSMGLVQMMNEDEQENTGNDYNFIMETDASVLLPSIIKGDLDIALLPANVAATLYQKMEGELTVININTLGVLYVVSNDAEVSEISDLDGKTLYLTGKGTTPDYAIQYLLEQNGLTTEDVTLEYKSEATEVAAALTADATAGNSTYGLLPQPFATAACVQNMELSSVIDLNEQWDKVSEDSQMVTGVTIVRNDFLEENPSAVETFLTEHKTSSDYANSNVEETAKLVVKYGILEKEPIAQKALPNCNITCITGSDMTKALSGYLNVLYNFSADSVGGSLPGEDFYYEK